MLLPRRREGASHGDDEEHGEDWQVALFMVGLVLFSPLVLALFDDPRQTIAGIPALYFFLFAGWALLIAVMAFVAESAPSRPFAAADDETRPLP